jgi:integrase
VRERWLTLGPRHVQRWVMNAETGKKVRRDNLVEGPLAASTVNHRLRALENMWTVLDGRHADNPVRDDVPEADEEEGPIRAIPPDVVRAILATMPDSATKARLRVMAATGLPHASLGRIAAADVDLKAKTVWVPGRKKGQGTRGRLMPITSEAVTAFRLLGRHDAWGAFSRGSLRRMWVRACHAAGLTVALRPYDLRHSMATLTLEATGDVRATQMLMGHSSPKVTERYARAAVDPALQAAVAKVDKAQKRRPKKGR